MGMLHVILRDGLENQQFIEKHTTGFEAVKESVQPWNPHAAAEKTGVPPEAIENAARWIAKAEHAIVLHARGIEHQSKGVENCLAVINLALATGHLGREGSGCAMITGQGNGQGGREHGQKCDQLPGQRTLTDPAGREHVAKVWGISPDELPQPGYSAEEIMEAIHRGEIKALLSLCFNPLVSLPDANYTREALDKLEFFGVIDFFLSETAHHADVVLAGSLQEEEEGLKLQRGGTGDSHPESRRSACERPDGYLDFMRTGETPGSRQVLSLSRLRAKYWMNCARRHEAGTPTITASLTRRVDEHMGLFWPCPSLDHPGNAAPARRRNSFHPDGKCRFHLQNGGRAAIRSDEISRLSDDGTGCQPISFGHADPAPRRPGGYLSRAAGWKFTRGSRNSMELRTETGHRETRRAEITLRALVTKTIRPDTVFIPYHWPGKQSANQLTHRTLDPRSKIPEFKVSACRYEKHLQLGGARSNVRLRILRRPFALHRLSIVCGSLRRMRDTSRRVDDQLRLSGPVRDGRHRRLRVLALRGTHLRHGVPGRRHQSGRRRRRSFGAEAPMHCLFKLRAGVSVRDSEDRSPNTNR